MIVFHIGFRTTRSRSLSTMIVRSRRASLSLTSLSLLLLLFMLAVGAAAGKELPVAASQLNATYIEPEPGTGTAQSLYFEETGHRASGPFLAYWQAHGGAAGLGFPLTEPQEQPEATNQEGSVVVAQWFTKARLELHTGLPGREPVDQIELGLVGQEALQALPKRERESFPVVPYPADPGLADQTYFPATGHTVQAVFLSYWQQNGGAAQFGFPLTEQFRQVNPANGQEYEVQWFERARFERHPEFAGTRYEMMLAPLGVQLLGVGASTTGQGQGQGQSGAIGGSNSVGTATNRLGYGMNVWLFGQDKNRVLGYVKEAGFSWVRQQVRWSDIEPAPQEYEWQELDRIVAATSENQLKLLLSVTHAPTWAGVGGTNGLPQDPANFGRFMHALSSRYKGRVLAYEIWNEQNLGLETGGQVEVGQYVHTLEAAYKAVKGSGSISSSDPNSQSQGASAAETPADPAGGDPAGLVVFGSLAPTGLVNPQVAVDDAVFLTLCYRYNGGELRSYFDVLGVHTGSAANPPDEFYPVDQPSPSELSRGWTTDPSFYFRRVENLRDIMVRYGDAAKTVWITEVGWTTANAAPGYEYGKLNTEQNQADYLVRAFERAKQNYQPWLGAMFVWQLNFATLPEVGPSDEKGPWGLLRADWSKRPAFEALKAMSKPSNSK